MNTSEHQDNSTALMGTGAGYELKHILSVATAYLETGQVDDAEDLLQEAIEVDAEHPDVKAFARRIDHAHGRTAANVTSNAEPVDAKSDVLLNFTRPLPGTEGQTPAVQRWIRDAESHYAAGRLYAALDSTYLTCAESPEFLPGFVRLAELQLALGKTQQARDMFNTLSSWHDIHEESPGWLVQSLQVALDPSDMPVLLEYAAMLVDTGDLSTLEPFVPAAISRGVSVDPDNVRQLSERYLQLRPESDEALQLHLQVVMAAGDPGELIEVTRQFVQPTSAPDLLLVRSVAESIAGAEEWLLWLERVTISIRLRPESYVTLQPILTLAQQLLPPGRYSLIAAITALAGESWQECVDSLHNAGGPKSGSAVEVFIAQYAQAIALDKLNSPGAGPALLEAAQIACQSDVEPFARATRMFGTGASPADLLKACVLQGGGASALSHLRALRDSNPDRLDIRSALAELCLASGNIHEAVRELRYIAQEHEIAGNLNAMVQAMRQISQAVPTNVEMKAKLIEGYLRRGVLDEAIVELDLIGDLYRDRNRTADAVAAFTRAAEIASATGAFSQGNALFHKAVEADPDDVPVRHAAVAFYLQTGSIGQAATQLREVVRIALLTDDRDEAVAALHQIIALAPQDPEAYHKLGEVLTSLGEYTQAERVYRRLATFSPHDPVLESKRSALAVLAATK